ncbi:dienelactone hydrolase family protein [Psychroflexus sp. CAK1W]|uniref:dienelactone hydrolase family protein n=1 Tax=Psychroflexus curvus TaxID=2873595 RepID=UPI001CCE2233|nr:dienelactone hydrolase family protein [Psychroflexus curvus]MBZ9628656.1 dienelactone hydrolase family protein [Psychroflexus curvus]
MKIYKWMLLILVIVFTACKSETKDKTEDGVNVVIEKNDIKIIGKEISYDTDSTLMRGYISHNEALEGKRPGILVVHEWWGHDEFAREKADELAELGYVALAVDMYGQGKQAQHPDEAMEFSSNVMKNFDTAKQRFMAAMQALKADKNVDPDNISAIGFCFGGSVALAMANSGVDLDAVAVFHSGLGLPVMPTEDIKTKLLIQNGAEDKMITDEQEKEFKAQLDAVNADYEYIAYEGVMHSFTNKDADSLAKKYELPLAYDEEVATKSWEKMTNFLEDIYSN